MNNRLNSLVISSCAYMIRLVSVVSIIGQCGFIYVLTETLFLEDMEAHTIFFFLIMFVLLMVDDYVGRS